MTGRAHRQRPRIPRQSALSYVRVLNRLAPCCRLLRPDAVMISACPARTPLIIPVKSADCCQDALHVGTVDWSASARAISMRPVRQYSREDGSVSRYHAVRVLWHQSGALPSLVQSRVVARRQRRMKINTPRSPASPSSAQLRIV